MLVAVEQGVAATWDAAMVARGRGGLDLGEETDQGSLAVQLAAALALDGYVEAAKGAIQVLGGMGFTWEHDAHIHLRRATTLRQLVGGTAPLRAESARLALAGWRRRLSIDLPPEAEALRAELDAAGRRPSSPSRTPPSASGRWPTTASWPPTGRPRGAATPGRSSSWSSTRPAPRPGSSDPSLAVAAWALPTIMAHGTAEQTERFVGPTLRGEIIWCQLFSEPGRRLRPGRADHPGHPGRRRVVADRPEGVDVGGGQRAHWGICLARTDPDVPKHRGITYFLVDMHSPGIEVRPLREITGAALFNEVFFDDCFVPDDCVVGEIDGGLEAGPDHAWPTSGCRSRRTRPSAERSRACSTGWRPVPDLQDPVTLDRLGHLLAEAQSLAQLGMRATLRSVGGLQPGSESSVRKLLGAEFDQRVHEFGLDICGPEGAVTEGDAAVSAYMVLQSKCMTIAGGHERGPAQRDRGAPARPAP